MSPAHDLTTQGKGELSFAQGFWQSPWLWAALVLGSLVPFLVTTVLPFNDLPNHVGRHYVFLNAASDPFLQQYYSVHWSIIGNLGIDLPVRLIGPWLGADLATHVVVATIPPLTILGIYALSRAINGSVTPGALLATLLAFNWPLITGFANFCLSAAIALLVLASWIRFRTWHFVWRFCVFTPLVFLTWLAHTAGWGLLGLGIAAYELARATEDGLDLKRLLGIPFQLLTFLPTFLFVVLWRQHAANGAAIQVGHDFLKGKAIALASLFREQIAAWDLVTTVAFFGLVAMLYWRGGRKLVRPAALIAAVYSVAFLLCPQEVFKSGFADRRLLTYAALMLPLGIGLAPEVMRDSVRRRAISLVAMACVGLFAARVGVSSVLWHRASELHESRLALIDRVPLHSRILGLVVESCGQSWNRLGRPDHIQQYALTRRASMINGMYQNPGLNQVTELFAEPTAQFDPGMYAMVHDQRCPLSYVKQTLQSAMKEFPRDRFDYVWLIGEDPLQAYDTRGVELIGTRENDRLYRVVPTAN